MKELVGQEGIYATHGSLLRKFVTAVLTCIISLVLVVPSAWAQTPKLEKQAMPEHPTKLEKRPLPQMPNSGSAGSAGNAQIVADKDSKGNLYVSGELIVTYESDVSDAEKKKVNDTVGAKVDDKLQRLPKVDADVLSFSKVKNEDFQKTRQEDLSRKKQELEHSTDVASVSYNYLSKPSFVPNDPYFRAGYQWDFTRTGTHLAWDKTTGYGARVAVLDTGFDVNHPDLRSKIVWQWDFFSGDSVANINYGYSDSGHGTHVAGTVAASTNNGFGVAGTAPRSQILAAKVCGPTWVGNTDYDVNGYEIRCPAQSAINALNYFASNASYSNIKVANLSLGGPMPYMPAYEAAVNNAWNHGIVVVVAAGNDAQKGNPVEYPAAFSRSLAVAATNSNNYWANFSNVQSYVDVSAPGVKILSTAPGGKFAYMNGTSMAAPHVSGLAALLASQGLNNYQIRYRIERTAVDLGARGWDPYYGYGRINALSAVSW